jgi:hypothetical protein
MAGVGLTQTIADSFFLSADSRDFAPLARDRDKLARENLHALRANSFNVGILKSHNIEC